MSAFEFVDELPTRPSNFAEGKGPVRDPLLVAFGEELRSHPGQWAKYPRELSPNARNNRQWAISKNDIRAPASLRGGGFEAAVRDGVLYVRYVGEVEQ